MSDRWSRRKWLKTVGAAGAGALVPLDKVAAELAAPVSLAARPQYSNGAIVELYSTSDVFIPPRGESFMKFSFDFPEPAVVFGEHRFSFLVLHGGEHVRLDRARMQARRQRRCACSSPATGWSGPAGRRRRRARSRCDFTRSGRTIEWDITARDGTSRSRR